MTVTHIWRRTHCTKPKKERKAPRMRKLTYILFELKENRYFYPKQTTVRITFSECECVEDSRKKNIFFPKRKNNIHVCHGIEQYVEDTKDQIDTLDVIDIYRSQFIYCGLQDISDTVDSDKADESPMNIFDRMRCFFTFRSLSFRISTIRNMNETKKTMEQPYRSCLNENV